MACVCDDELTVVVVHLVFGDSPPHRMAVDVEIDSRA